MSAEDIRGENHPSPQQFQDAFRKETECKAIRRGLIVIEVRPEDSERVTKALTGTGKFTNLGENRYAINPDNQLGSLRSAKIGLKRITV